MPVSPAALRRCCLTGTISCSPARHWRGHGVLTGWKELGKRRIGGTLRAGYHSMRMMRRALRWSGGAAICGVTIALAETFVNYVGGGVTPVHVLATLVAGYAVAGAVYGALLGLVTVRREPSRAAVVAAAVFGYGLLRIYEPSGWKAEPAFLVLCLGFFGALRGLRLCDGSSPGWRGTAECLTLALGAIIAGTFVIEEVAERDLKGAQPLVLLVLLPVVVLAVHRGIVALVRRPAVVILAEVA